MFVDKMNRLQVLENKNYKAILINILLKGTGNNTHGSRKWPSSRKELSFYTKHGYQVEAKEG